MWKYNWGGRVVIIPDYFWFRTEDYSYILMMFMVNVFFTAVGEIWK